MRVWTEDAVAELAPQGVLRAAINLGNSVLAQRKADGSLTGVTVALAGELARRLGVPCELIPFDAAGKVLEACREGRWDVAFVAIEPARALEMSFSPPYARIDGTYMVRDESPLTTPEDVDAAGIRIAVGNGSAYDLYLTRTIRDAEIVRAHTGGGKAMIELYLEKNLDAVAGIRQDLEAYAARHEGFRVMESGFMEINQALAVPKGRPRALEGICAFVEEVKASGFAARAFEKNGQPASIAIA